MLITIRYGSVCSGIEAATCAWHPLGWHAAWLAEIEPFPCAVLAHHYPSVPNLGDMTTIADRIASGEIEAPDVLTGGTPCQAFSVAGLRKGLDDARGQLTIAFFRLADAIDAVRLDRGESPSIIVWENVPGVLSDKGNAFGCFLAGLAGEDDALQPPGDKWANAGVVYGPTRTVAWRVLDAQYFGVAQRRRRVWVVASARQGFDPASVLFEFDGVRRDSAPSREAREGAAGGVERSVALRGREGGATAELGGDVADCLRESAGGGDKPHALCFGGNRTSGPIEISPALLAQPGSGWKGDFESETFVAIGQVVTQKLPGPCLQALVDAMVALGWRDPDGHNVTSPVTCVTGDRTHALKAEGADGSEDGTGRGTPIIEFGAQMSTPQVDFDLMQTLQAKNPMAAAIPYDLFQITAPINRQNRDETSPCHMLAKENAAHAAVVQAVAIHENQRAEVTLNDTAGTVKCAGGKPGQGYPAALVGMQVRRLTPEECEKLQGFPVGYTRIPWRKKPAEECPDGPRYKALGNSWAVPCAAWIGRRIHFAIGTPANDNRPPAANDNRPPAANDNRPPSP